MASKTMVTIIAVMALIVIILLIIWKLKDGLLA